MISLQFLDVGLTTNLSFALQPNCTLCVAQVGLPFSYYLFY